MAAPYDFLLDFVNVIVVAMMIVSTLFSKICVFNNSLSFPELYVPSWAMQPITNDSSLGRPLCPAHVREERLKAR
jgi:hypothetical protein